MSLLNCTLLRVDPPAARTPAGDDVSPTPGPALSVRCVLDEPTTAVRWLIDDLELESTDVLYVRTAAYPAAAAAIAADGQVLLQLDGQAQQLMRVDHVKLRVMSGLSHVQALLRRP